MKALRRKILVMTASLVPLLAAAQYREGSPPVIQPEPEPRIADPRPALERAFGQDYARAGSPAFVLYWGRAFDDSLELESRKVTRKSTQNNQSETLLDRSTSGDAGQLRSMERDASGKKVVRTDEYEVKEDTAKRPMPFSARDEAEMRQAFVETLRRNGLTFVDRGVALRTESVKQNSTDVKRLETTSTQRLARYILEIAPVADDRAPSKVAFSLSVKELQGGRESASAYSMAVPWQPPLPPGRYVATEKGFTKTVPQPLPMSMRDIGAALAYDTMKALQPVLVPATPAATRKPGGGK